MPITSVTLNNAVVMPQLGFGTWQVGEAAVSVALEVGYRSFDTAEMYGNETEVGRAIAASGLPRDEVFVTTKVWNDHHGYRPTLDAFDASRQRLGLDVVDLYLIHWPQPRLGLYAETWGALEELYHDGKVRVIGVANFSPSQLDELMSTADVVPALNQIELNVGRPRPTERSFHASHGIVTEAWEPLARGGRIMRHRTIRAAAEAHDATPAQVMLRWLLQSGVVAIPRSSRPERIAENFDVMSFELSDEEMGRLSTLG